MNVRLFCTGEVNGIDRLTGPAGLIPDEQIKITI
jgi:hypothetical protein